MGLSRGDRVRAVGCVYVMCLWKWKWILRLSAGGECGGGDGDGDADGTFRGDALLWVMAELSTCFFSCHGLSRFSQGTHTLLYILLLQIMSATTMGGNEEVQKSSFWGCRVLGWCCGFPPLALEDLLDVGLSSVQRR